MLGGLAHVNIELTRRCNKNCWMCGRRKLEREHPELALSYGDMDWELLTKIADQLPRGVTVQLHNNGEPLLYPRLGDALFALRRNFTAFDTNGKLLIEKYSEIVGVLDSLAISVIENDDEAHEQFNVIKEFLRIKGDQKPLAVLRINGDVNVARYEALGIPMTFRQLHNPIYHVGCKQRPIMPEIGVCLELLHKLSIRSDGMVSMCVRLDPDEVGIIGDANTQSLDEIWNGMRRETALAFHKIGQRNAIQICKTCDYWGIPR
jgi:radical SAM protein with 4Fe4S-binding SPASM domain